MSLAPGELDAMIRDSIRDVVFFMVPARGAGPFNLMIGPSRKGVKKGSKSCIAVFDQDEGGRGASRSSKPAKIIAAIDDRIAL